MSITYQRLKPFLLTPNTPEREVATILERIKGTYTFNRSDLEQKQWTPKEVSAYASFYLPTNYQKFSMLMKQLPLEIKSQLGSCKVIDFGTGPGTYLLAFIDYFGADAASGFIGIDKDLQMIDQAKSLVKGLFPDSQRKVEFRTDIPSPEDEASRLLIFGNSLNELTVEHVKDIIRKIDPQFILFIEPGTPAVFDSIVNIREWLGEEDFDCFYPCPSLKSECPVAARVSAGQDDWCHQVWRGTHDDQVERLGQMAKIDRKVMPFIGHIYGKTVVHAEAPQVRFMRFLLESKHSFEWEVCLLKDEGLRLLTFEIPKKSFSKKEQKLMKKMSVGENFSFEIIKKLSDSRWRVNISL
jgi:hypothetical protein